MSEGGGRKSNDVKSLSQGPNVDPTQPGLDPGLPYPEVKCLPLGHLATKVVSAHTR